MFTEYIRYRIDPSQEKAFLGAYETASKSLRDSSHCIGYELASAPRRGRVTFFAFSGIRRGSPPRFPEERAVQAVFCRCAAVHEEHRGDAALRADPSLLVAMTAANPYCHRACSRFTSNVEETAMSLKDPNVTNAKKKKRVAVVLANPAVSTTTNWPVGFWWSEPLTPTSS